MTLSLLLTRASRTSGTVSSDAVSRLLLVILASDLLD